MPPRDWEMGNVKGKSDSGELRFESLFFSGRGMVYSFKHERRGDDDNITIEG